MVKLQLKWQDRYITRIVFPGTVLTGTVSPKLSMGRRRDTQSVERQVVQPRQSPMQGQYLSYQSKFKTNKASELN